MTSLTFRTECQSVFAEHEDDLSVSTWLDMRPAYWGVAPDSLLVTAPSLTPVRSPIPDKEVPCFIIARCHPFTPSSQTAVFKIRRSCVYYGNYLGPKAPSILRTLGGPVVQEWWKVI